MAIHRVPGATLRNLTVLNVHRATRSTLLYALIKAHCRWTSTPTVRYVAHGESKSEAPIRITNLAGVGNSVPQLVKPPRLSPDDADRLSSLLCEPHATPGGVLKRAIANGEAPLGVVGKSPI